MAVNMGDIPDVAYKLPDTFFNFTGGGGGCIYIPVREVGVRPTSRCGTTNFNDSIVSFHLTHQQYTTFVPMLYAAKTDSNLYRYGHMYFQTVFVTVSSVASRTFASSSLLARRPSHQPPYGITSSRPPSCCLPLPSAPHSPTPTPGGGGGSWPVSR